MPSLRRLQRYVQSEVPIYKLVLGDFHLNEVMSSPFRKDKNPSFIVTISKKGLMYWRDFALPDQQYWDAVGLIQYTYSVTRQEAINFAWNKLVLDKEVELTSHIDYIPIQKDKKELPYTYMQQSLRDWELEYWKEHLVDERLLSFYNIHSLAGLYRDDVCIWESKKESPAYIYLWEENEDAFKAYRPLETEHFKKWRGQANGDWIQGWGQLPYKADHLFIQSSMKDTVVCRGMGVLGCAPQSETSRKALLEKKEEIDGRFDNVFIMYDNDRAGIECARVLASYTGWKPVFLPHEWAKDPAEFIRKTGNHLRLNEFFSNLGVENRYKRV